MPSEDIKVPEAVDMAAGAEVDEAQQTVEAEIRQLMMERPKGFEEAIKAKLLAIQRRSMAERVGLASGQTEAREGTEASSREQELLDRQSGVARGDLDRHPFMEHGRVFAAEYIAHAGFESAGFLGIGSGREAEVLAEIAKLEETPLQRIVGVDLAYKDKPADGVMERIRSAGPEGLTVEIHGESFADRGFEVPQVDAIYMGVTLHDQSQGEQAMLLRSAYEQGVQAIVINDVILSEAPNYGEALDDLEMLALVEAELVDFYGEWLEATAASGLAEDVLNDYAGKVLTKAFPKALEHNNRDEQFETIETLTAKLEAAGYRVTHVEHTPGSHYIKTVVAERIS